MRIYHVQIEPHQEPFISMEILADTLADAYELADIWLLENKPELFDSKRYGKQGAKLSTETKGQEEILLVEQF